MVALWLTLMPLIDVFIIVALVVWRAKGKPLPRRLQWLKKHRLTSRVFNRWQPVPLKF